MSKLTKAFETVRKAIEDDTSYARSWYDNIACAAYDQGLNWKAANKVAESFMSRAFGVDTSEFNDKS